MATGPPDYTITPSLSERPTASNMQLAGQQNPVNQPTETTSRERDRDVLERDFPKPSTELDTATALARKPLKGTFGYKLAQEWQAVTEHPSTEIDKERASRDFVDAKKKWKEWRVEAQRKEIPPSTSKDGKPLPCFQGPKIRRGAESVVSVVKIEEETMDCVKDAKSGKSMLIFSTSSLVKSG